MIKSVCVIPARMSSSRFPGKPLAPILGMPMLGHVALRCKLEPVVDLVVVATCDAAIVDYCATLGVKAIMTSSSHHRASDRVQEAVRALEKELEYGVESVTMVQGDEPMVTPGMIRAAVSGLEASGAPVVNLVSRITDDEEFRSPNSIKVVLSESNDALYMSRSPIPSTSHGQPVAGRWKQVCVIPFRRAYLDAYSALEPTPLEISESVDMLRCLGHGHRVHMVPIEEASYPVDVPSDVDRVEKHLKDCPLVKRYLR